MSETLSEVLSRSTAAMVAGGKDLTGALATLLHHAVDALGATSGGILVRGPRGTLELLAATSHRAADLELAQLQAEEGPCFDSINESVVVQVEGRDALLTRWPTTGRHMIEAGYDAVQATPMTWRGQTFGGLNIFWAAQVPVAADTKAARALADATTMLLLSRGPLPPQLLTESVSKGLADRVVIEQAKGALAHVRSLDGAGAYETLVDLARSEDITLGEAARRVLEQARQRRLT